MMISKQFTIFTTRQNNIVFLGIIISIFLQTRLWTIFLFDRFVILKRYQITLYNIKMKILGLTVITILLALALAQRRKCQKVNYQFNLLALTWLPQFCHQTRCVDGWQNKWDGSSLTIHGFWPSSTNTAYLTCFDDYGVDIYCDTPFSFQRSYFTEGQIDELNLHWPAFGPKKNFWQYEWGKHGVCYLNLTLQLNKSGLNNQKIQHNYFMGTVQKVKTLGLKLEGGEINSKKALADIFHLSENQFIPICRFANTKRYLGQIRICYSISAIPGKERIIDCPSSQDINICTFPIQVTAPPLSRSSKQSSFQQENQEQEQDELDNYIYHYNEGFVPQIDYYLDGEQL